MPVMAKACSPAGVALTSALADCASASNYGNNLACFGGREALQKGEIFRESFLKHEGSDPEVSLRGLHLAGKILFFSDFQDVCWTLQSSWTLQGRCNSPQCLGGPLNGLVKWLMGMSLLQPNGLLNRNV